MVMSTKQSKVHDETIWKSTDLRNFPSLDLANLSIYMETGESCCLKWSFSLTLCEIPWRLSSILPNVKISLTHCKIPWQFTDLEKFYFSLTFPWRLWTLQGCHKFHGRYGRNGATYTCDYHDPCWLLSPWLWYTMTINSHIIHWLLSGYGVLSTNLFTCLLFSFNVLISPAKFMHETAIISPPRYLPIDMPRALSIPTFGVHVQ